jgi:hypothetical protein
MRECHAESMISNRLQRKRWDTTDLESTLTRIPASVAFKRLTQTLNTLESTLMKNIGGGVSYG